MVIYLMFLLLLLFSSYFTTETLVVGYKIVAMVDAPPVRVLGKSQVDYLPSTPQNFRF